MNSAFAETYIADAENFGVTLDLVSLPSSRFVRIVQRLDLGESNPTMRTRLEFSLPAHAPNPQTGHAVPIRCLAPIAFVKKHGLSDLLSITPTPSTIAPLTLGAHSTNLVSRSILRAYAGILSDQSLDRALVQSCCMKIPTQSTAQAWKTYESLVLHLTSVYGSPLKEEAFEFQSLARRFVARRPLYVPCSTEDGIAYIEFSQLQTRAELRADTVIEGTRFVFGRTSTQPRVDMSYSAFCQSYHLHVAAPNFQYFKAARVKYHTLATKGERQIRSRFIEDFPHTDRISGVRPDASGHIHIQTRELGGHPYSAKGIVAELKVAEQPFGELGVALTRLGVALAVVVTVLVLGSTLAVNPIQTLSALLLALPGLLGASIFLPRHGDEGRHGPILARFISVTAAASAITSSVLLAAWTIAANRELLDKTPKEVRQISHFDAPPSVSEGLGILLVADFTIFVVGFVLLGLNWIAFSTARRGMLSQKRTRP